MRFPLHVTTSAGTVSVAEAAPPVRRGETGRCRPSTDRLFALTNTYRSEAFASAQAAPGVIRFPPRHHFVAEAFMSYLFGDSTPSTLQIDYIQFLRDAFDCCIDILRADERIAQQKVRLEALEKAAAVELLQVQMVAGLVPKAFDGVALGAPESPAARCAAAIMRSAAALAAATVADVK